MPRICDQHQGIGPQADDKLNQHESCDQQASFAQRRDIAVGVVV
jgi:hypothetical protein